MEKVFIREDIFDFFKQEKYVLLFLIFFHFPKLSIVKLLEILKEERAYKELCALNNVQSLVQRQKLYGILKEMENREILVKGTKFERHYRARELNNYSINPTFFLWMSKQLEDNDKEMDEKIFGTNFSLIAKHSQKTAIVGIIKFLKEFDKKIEYIVIVKYIYFILDTSLTCIYDEGGWGSSKKSDKELVRTIINIENYEKDLFGALSDTDMENLVPCFEYHISQLEHEVYTRTTRRKRKTKTI